MHDYVAMWSPTNLEFSFGVIEVSVPLPSLRTSGHEDFGFAPLPLCTGVMLH